MIKFENLKTQFCNICKSKHNNLCWNPKCVEYVILEEAFDNCNHSNNLNQHSLIENFCLICECSTECEDKKSCSEKQMVINAFKQCKKGE